MDEAKFWSLVEAAKEGSEGDLDTQLEFLVERLAKLPAAQIKEFDRLLRDLMARSYTWELWAACFILNAGCSDDGFDYFRGWLIAQGKDVFYKALQDPETLADLDIPAEEPFEFESMLYAGVTAYEERTGKELPADLRGFQYDLTGTEWSEGELDEKYPKLSAKASS